MNERFGIMPDYSDEDIQNLTRELEEVRQQERDLKESQAVEAKSRENDIKAAQLKKEIEATRNRVNYLSQVTRQQNGTSPTDDAQLLVNTPESTDNQAPDSEDDETLSYPSFTEQANSEGDK